MATTQVSTTETLTRDMQASLVKNALEVAGVAADKQAERTARLAVGLTDAATYDAAVWKGAEGLFNAMDPSGSDWGGLRYQPVKIRAAYLTLAIQCFTPIRVGLEGGFTPESMQQAWCDIQNHREALAARRALRSVEGGGR